MTEIALLLTMNYEDVWHYLQNKYGRVLNNYFTDETMTKKTQGITRAKAGLYIHHIDEDKAILLSTPIYAQRQPFAYQSAARLVYCNLLEHLVLHIKIFEYPHPHKASSVVVGVGGIYAFIVPELNDIYSGIKYRQRWKQKVSANVLPFKNEYFKCIKKLLDLGFRYPLLRSFNQQFGWWDNKNNEQLYAQMKKLGVKH